MSDSNESSGNEAYYSAEEGYSSGDDSSSGKTATPKGYDQINGVAENKASIGAGASASLIRQSSSSSEIEKPRRKIEEAQLGQRGIQTIDCPETQSRPRKGNVSQSSFRLSCACCRSQGNNDPDKKEAYNCSTVSGSVNLACSPITPAEVSSGARACIPGSCKNSVATSSGSTVAGNIAGDTSRKESCSSSPNISLKCSGDSTYKNFVNKVPKDKDRSQPRTRLLRESVSYSQAESKSLEGRTQMDETKGEMVQSGSPGNLTAYPLELSNIQQEVPDSSMRDLAMHGGNVAAAAEVPVRSFAEVVMSPAAPPTPLQRPGQKRSPHPRTGKTPKKKAKSEKNTAAKFRLQANVAIKKRTENSSGGAASKGEIADQPARRPDNENRAGGSGGGTVRKVEIASQAVIRPADSNTVRDSSGETVSKGEIADQRARGPVDTSQTGGNGGGTARKVEIASQAVRRPIDTTHVAGNGSGAASKGEIARQVVRRPIDTSETGGNGGGAVSKGEIASQAVRRPIDSSQMADNGCGAVSKGEIVRQVVRRPIDTSQTGDNGGAAVSKGEIVRQVVRRPNGTSQTGGNGRAVSKGEIASQAVRRPIDTSHMGGNGGGAASKGEIVTQVLRRPNDTSQTGGIGGGAASKGEMVRQVVRRPIDTSHMGGNGGGAFSKGEIASQAVRRPADSSRVGGNDGGAASKGEIVRQVMRRPIDTSQTGGNGGGAASKGEMVRQVVRRPIDTSHMGGNGGGAFSKGEIASQAVRRPADSSRVGGNDGRAASKREIVRQVMRSPIDTSQTGGNGGGAFSKGEIASQAARPADSSRVGGSGDQPSKGAAANQTVGKVAEIPQTVLTQVRSDALPDELCSTPRTSEEEETESVRQDNVRPIMILVKGMHNNVCSLVEIVKNTPYAFVPGKGLSSQYHRIGNTLSAVIQWMSQFCDALDKAQLKRSAEKGVIVLPPVALGNLREISARVDQLCAVLSEAYRQGRMAQNGSKIKHHMAKEKQKTTVRVRVIMEKLNDLRRRLDERIAGLQPSPFETQPVSSAAAFPLSVPTPLLKPLPTPVKDTSKENLPSDRSDILNAQPTIKTDNEMPKHLPTNESSFGRRSALGPQAVPPEAAVSHSCSPYGRSSCFDFLQTGRSNCNQTGLNGESGNSKVFTERGGANAIPPPVRPIRQAWARCTKVQQNTSHLQVPVKYQTNLIGHCPQGFARDTNEVIENVEQSSHPTNLAPPRNPNKALYTSPPPVQYSHVAPLRTSMQPSRTYDSVQPFCAPTPQPCRATNATRLPPGIQAIPVRSPTELMCDVRTATLQQADPSKGLTQPSNLATANSDTQSSLEKKAQHRHLSPAESVTPAKTAPWKAAEQAPAEVPIPTEDIGQTGANSLIPDVIPPLVTGPDVDLASYGVSPVCSVSELRSGKESVSIDSHQFGCTVEENTQISPGRSVKNPMRLFVAQKDKFINMCLSGMKTMTKRKDDSPRPSDGPERWRNVKFKNLSSVKEACLDKNVASAENIECTRDEIYPSMPSPNSEVNGNDRCDTPAQYHASSSQTFERCWKSQSVPSAPCSAALPEASKYQSSISTVTTIPVRTSVEGAVGFLGNTYLHHESAKTRASMESTQQPQFSRNNAEVVQQVESSGYMQTTGTEDAKKKDEIVDEATRLMSNCVIVGNVNNGQTDKPSDKGCANTAEIKQSSNVLCDCSSPENSPTKGVERRHICKSGPVPRTRLSLKAKRRLKYVDAAEQPDTMDGMQNGAVRNEASVATMEERGAHQDNRVNGEALTVNATSPGTKLPVSGVKVRSNHEMKGNMESVDAVRSTGKTPLPCIEESPENVNDEELHTEEQLQKVTSTTTAENGIHLKNGDSQSSSTAKSPATPASAGQSASPITPNTPELNPGLPKTRPGNHGTPNRRRRGKYNYDTVNYRKSINCCCEDVCDYCVP